MSTDGDIEISVRAEGAEDAAGDLAEQGGGGGGGGDGGPGGLAGRAGRSGTLGFVLGALLGPILNVLEPILGILQAFLAPVALILLRVFQPVLRLLVRILPIWLSFMSDVYDFVDRVLNIQRQAREFLSTLPGRFWRALSNGASWFANGASAIGSEVWNAIKTKFNELVKFVKNLPRKIGRTVSRAVPGVDFNGDDGGAGSAAAGLATNENVRQGTKVILRGGVESFVETVERETGVDLLP